MKTSSFFDYPTGPGRISIARTAPRGYAAGYRVFSPLAPGPWFRSVTRAEYERLFFAQLAELDAFTTFQRLHELAGEAEPVLLCWERSQSCANGAEWCHRHMVKTWFRDRLQIDVPELVVR